MIILKKDLRTISKNIFSAMEYGADGIITTQHICDPQKLIICPSQCYYEDYFFSSAENGNNCTLYNARDVYECLALIDKGKTAPLLATDEQGRVDHTKIDIGQMIMQRTLVSSLKNTLPFTDWDYDYSDDSEVRMRGAAVVSKVIKDIRRLCEMSYGASLAAECWKGNSPNRPLPLEIEDALRKAEPAKQEMEKVKMQYKLTGFSSFYSQSIEPHIRNNKAEIIHHYEETHKGSYLSGDIYLRRNSATSSYELQQFSLSVTPPGKDTALQGKFYLNEPLKPGETRDNTGPVYTLEKAFNFLSGRPIFLGSYHTSTSDYDRWEKINPNKQMLNGGFGVDRFDTKQFDLLREINALPFEGVNKAKMEARIVEQLRSGELVPLRLINKAGEKKHIYISANPTTKSISLFNQFKMPLTANELKAGNFIDYQEIKKFERLLRPQHFSRFPLQQGKNEHEENNKRNRMIIHRGRHLF